MHQPTDTTGSSYYRHQPYYHNPSADPPPHVTAAAPYAHNPYASAPPVSDYSNSLPSFPPNTDHVPNFNPQYNFPYPYQHNQPPVNYDYSIPSNPNPNPNPNPQLSSNLYGASSLPYHTNYGGDQEPFNEGVYKYNGGGGGSGKGGRTDSGSGFGKGGRSELESGGGVMFDDYGRPINVSGGKEQSGFGNSSINKIVKAAPKVEDESQDVSVVQKYRVKHLSEGFGQTDMDVLCQIGLDGIWFLDPATSRTLKIYPLETLTRWEVLDSYIFAFWAKTSVDPEPRRVRLKSSSYTTSNILDTITAASMQSKEIGTSSNPADLVKGSDQSAEKRRGFDWKNLIKPVNEEKDHWVPDEVVTKCTACAADFSAFNRKHHCRNCGDIFCDKCTQGRIALTADEDAQQVQVCDRCMKMLGLGEALRDDIVEEKSQSLKLVPWISWDEWKLVRDSLLSSSPNSVTSALQRVTTWRSRGCIPMAVEVTASIVEIQHKDPYFRDDLNESAMQSEDILAMLYCMAIMRLVNGVVEKTRKKNEISIGEAADAIGLPRMLIDIRHEGSHRDLPSLQLVRLASKKALDWLILYYWEPQGKEIPIQTNQTVNLKKEIKRRLREVALCLKEKKKKSISSHVETKRVKQTEHIFGRNKFLHPGAGKPSHSNYTGSKKQLTKSLKNVLRLYSSFSPEVVYALLECFLRALDSSNLAEHVDNSENGENKQTEYDDWKSVVLKLSRKEPEFLLTLTQAVLEKMETQEATNCEIDDSQSSENSSQHRHIELLSSLLEWLIEILKKSILDNNKKESTESNGSLAEKHLPALLRRCLLVSPSSNKHLMASAFTLAELTGNNTLLYKLRKLSLLGLSNSETNSVSSSSNETFLSLQEYSIRQAEEKFKLIRFRKMQSKKENQKDNEIETKSKWVVAKSWNPCPIGTLPHKIGFSGRLPVLDFADESREVAKLSAHKKQGQGDLNLSIKREAENAIEEFDTTSVKKVKGIEADCVSYDEVATSLQGVKGHMMIDGVWRKVAEEEFCGIVSAVRLLA